MQKKRVLTTGGNGLLGQKLTERYSRLAEVDLLVTGIGDDRLQMPSGYTYEQMDVVNHEESYRIIKKFRPETIIHTAAMTNVDACETEREACMELNVYAVENLAKISKEIGAHFIHISTDFIFPGTKAMYTEEDEAEPLSYYGMSKWEGEKRVAEFAANWSILRTAIVFGVAKNLSRTNIVKWAYETLKSGGKANVVNDQFRTPTLAEDLALGCYLADSKSAYGVYNICGKDFMGIYEMVERIARHFGFTMDNITSVSSATLNQPAKRPPITGLNIDKARKVLGYEPHSFEEALDIFVKQLGN